MKQNKTTLTNLVSWEYYRIYHTVIVIKVSYLVLVDEEKHDGQNLQEEDEQEQNEELWRHKGKRKGQLIEYNICQGGDEDHRGITDTCRWRV